MARLFTSGFEINSATAGVEFTEPEVSVVPQTTVFATGSRALRITSLTSGTYSGSYARFSASAIAGPVYMRVRFRAAAWPTSTTSIAVLTGASSASATSGPALKLNSDGTLSLHSPAGSIGTSSALALETWYVLEMLMDASPASGSRVLTARIDGTQFATSSTVGSMSNPLAVMVGGNVQDEAQTGGDFFFDDLAVNDSTGSFQNSWPGNSRVAYLWPTRAGDSNQWNNTSNAAGSSNNYQLVDENPPDNQTTMVQTDTLNNQDLYGFQAAGVGDGATINCLQVLARHRNNTADATAGFALVLEKAPGGTKAQGSTVVPNSTTWRTGIGTTSNITAATLTSYQDPDGADWTPTTLDTLQAGPKLVVAGTNRVQVSTVWIVVDYTPATLQVVNHLEGSDETSITTGNSGGASGDAFDTVPSGGTKVYDTAQSMHGSSSMRYGTTVIAATARVLWNDAGALNGTYSRLWGRLYFRCATGDTNGRNLVSIRNATAGTTICRVSASAAASPKVAIINSAGSTLATGSHTIAANTWYRLEWSLGVGTSAAAVVRLFAGDSTTLTEQVATTSDFGTAIIDEVSFGQIVSSASVPGAWLDEFEVNNYDWPGPYVEDSSVDGVLAGTLPALTGSLAGVQTQSGALAGTLPALSGALAGVVPEPVAGVLAAVLPAATGAVVGVQSQAGVLAGGLPALTGAVAAVQSQAGALAGTLPAAAGTFVAGAAQRGVVAGTLPALAGAAAGSVAQRGDLAGVLPTLTGALAGEAEGLLGDLAATLPALSGAASGVVAQRGDLAATFPALTGQAAGVVPFRAVLAGTLPALTGAAAGTQTQTGTLAGVLPALTGAFAGVQPHTGVLAGLLPAATATLAGAHTQVGELAGTLPAPTGVAAGVQAQSGTLAAALPTLAGVAAGTVTQAGALAGTLPAVTGAIAGGTAAPGAIIGVLPAATGVFTATQAVEGELAGTLPAPTGAVAAGVAQRGTIAGTLPAPTGTATGAVVIVGQFAATLPALAGDLAGGSAQGAALTGVLPAATGASAATATVPGVLNATLPAPTSTTSGTVRQSGTLNATLPPLAGAVDAAVAFRATLTGVLPAPTAVLVGSGGPAVPQIPGRNVTADRTARNRAAGRAAMSQASGRTARNRAGANQ